MTSVPALRREKVRCMLCEINNRPVPCEWIYFREFDYGRGHPQWQAVKYSMSLEMKPFTEALFPLYSDYVRDDREHGALDDDEVVLHLRGLGWPGLSALAVEQPRLLEAFILEQVAYSAIQALFPPYTQRPRYLIDSVERVEISGERITLSGWALTVP
jgi:hypothetical protein